MIRTILALLIATMSLTAHAGRLFGEIVEMPHVESLYMSNEIISQIQPQRNLISNNYIKRLGLMETLTIGKNDAARTKTRTIVKNLKLTLLLETRDNSEGESSFIYISKPKDGSQTTETVIIINEDPEEMEVIHIEGEISIPDLINRYSHFTLGRI